MGNKPASDAEREAELIFLLVWTPLGPPWTPIRLRSLAFDTACRSKIALLNLFTNAIGSICNFTINPTTMGHACEEYMGRYRTKES